MTGYAVAIVLGTIVAPLLGAAIFSLLLGETTLFAHNSWLLPAIYIIGNIAVLPFAIVGTILHRLRARSGRTISSFAVGIYGLAMGAVCSFVPMWLVAESSWNDISRGAFIVPSVGAVTGLLYALLGLGIARRVNVWIAQADAVVRRRLSAIVFVAASLGAIGVVLFVVHGVTASRRSAKMTQTAGNARGIYMLMFAAEMDAYEAGAPSVYPSPTREWSSSTAYFNAGSTNIFADVEPSFFSAPGIAAATQWPMTAANNAWSLNASFANAEFAPSETPFIFTRNLRFRVDDSGKVKPYLTDEEPFGKLGCVVVTLGGSTKRLMPKNLGLAAPNTDPEHVAHILRP